MSRPISRKQQVISTRQQVDAAKLDIISQVYEDKLGTQIAKIVSALGESLSAANYQAFRAELVGLDPAQRLTICKKWLSMTLVLQAAVRKNGSADDMPGGQAAFRFYKAIEDARNFGWVIQDARKYLAVVNFAYWGLSDVDEDGQAFGEDYVPFLGDAQDES